MSGVCDEERCPSARCSFVRIQSERYELGNMVLIRQHDLKQTV
jgi:hypothetical protein